MRLPDHVTLTPVDPEPGDDGGQNGAVLLDERTGRYYHLNPTAHLIVAGLLEGATQAEAAERLAAACPDAAARADTDTGELIAHLTRAGLLERR
ncbi:lasso peptide biosynthesis PqqD family chaperone [Actinoallomurus sp. NPDC050550]|uniref:lasso peptide biosynthesis PqqD family chaperone n=1 Tax=Actinoallomurus sp. NPDC050550 TaxID=3154937 RepID=UPI0033CE1095